MLNRIVLYRYLGVFRHQNTPLIPIYIIHITKDIRKSQDMGLCIISGIWGFGKII
jgi:hypothetical protein